MTTPTTTIQTACPECDGVIPFDRPPLSGQVSTCATCAVELEVVALNPLRVELAPEVEEDWGE